MFFHACAHVLAIPRRPCFLCALICLPALGHGHTCKSPRAAWHIRMSWQTRVHIFWHVYCVFTHVHCDGAHERVLRHAHVYICVHTCDHSKPQPTLGPTPTPDPGPSRSPSYHFSCLTTVNPSSPPRGLDTHPAPSLLSLWPTLDLLPSAATGSMSPAPNSQLLHRELLAELTPGPLLWLLAQTSPGLCWHVPGLASPLASTGPHKVPHPISFLCCPGLGVGSCLSPMMTCAL